MDGNNRWSKKKNFTKFNGYKEGSKTLINLTSYLFKNTDTRFISAFALSKNNLNRSKNLIKTLKKVLLEFLNKKINKEIENNFKIKFIGDRKFLDKEINEKIDFVERLEQKSLKTLLIYINYSGKDDIKQAAERYCSDKNKTKFEDHLLTKDIPEPDLLIRTGGYKRLSDFLIYQSTFTELFFINKLWPDMSNRDLTKILNKFYLLERKFGL